MLHNASVFSIQDAFLSVSMSTGQMGCRAFSGKNKMAFECAEDPHQVRGRVTRILNITFRVHFYSCCQSFLGIFHIKQYKLVFFFLFTVIIRYLRHMMTLKGMQNASHVVETTTDI